MPMERNNSSPLIFPQRQRPSGRTSSVQYSLRQKWFGTTTRRLKNSCTTAETDSRDDLVTALNHYPATGWTSRMEDDRKMIVIDMALRTARQECAENMVGGNCDHDGTFIAPQTQSRSAVSDIDRDSREKYRTELRKDNMAMFQTLLASTRRSAAYRNYQYDSADDESDESESSSEEEDTFPFDF